MQSSVDLDQRFDEVPHDEHQGRGPEHKDEDSENRKSHGDALGG